MKFTKQQYDQVSAILRGDLPNDDKALEIDKVLGTALSDLTNATAFKDKVIGNETMIVTNNADGTVSVSFGGVEVTATTFALAFISTVMNVLANRALEKFLPQEKPAPATGSRDGAAASPAGVRALPAGINRG